MGFFNSFGREAQSFVALKYVARLSLSLPPSPASPSHCVTAVGHFGKLP